MDEITLASESIQLISKDLGLEENISLEGSDAPFERLEIWLEKQISMLLNRDFQRLLTALYRIDISESQLNQILNESKPEEVSRKLAKAILEREKQKVFTRWKYRQP